MSATTFSGTFGDCQLAASHRGVLLDVQGQHWTTDGRRARDHGYVQLDIAEAIVLWQRLGQIIEDAKIAAPASPAPIWSEATVQAIADRLPGRPVRPVKRRERVA